MRSPERSEEVIKLCKTLIECTHYDDVKYDALRILAETYHETGQQALVEPTLEAIPEIYFTKLELMGQLLEGEKSFKAAKDQLSINLDSSVEMLQIMKGYLTEKGNVAEVKKCEEMQHRITEMLEE